MPPINKTRQGTESPKKPATVDNSTWLVIIIIAVLVLAVFGYFFGYPLFQKYWNNRFVNQIPEAPPVIQEADTATLSPVIEEIVFTEEVPSIPKGYYIIAGSFRNKNYADDMVSSNKDIELETLYFEDLGIYRVSAGYFGNIHQAYNKIYGTRDFDRFDDVWVLEYQ